MKKNLFQFLLLISAAALFLSCQKEEEEEHYDVSRFFSEYLKIICDNAASCEAGFVTAENRINCPDIIMYHPFPFPAFKREEKVIFKQKFEMLRSDEEVGWIEVNNKKVKECFDALEEVAQCDPMETSLFEIVACVNVFEGTKSIRQDCGQDEECFYGWCDKRGGRCPGSCVEYKEPGQSCNVTLDRCVPGYTCRTNGCSESSIGVAGDPCLSDIDCSPSLYCRKSSESDATGRCFWRKSHGEPCIDVNECMIGLDCINNLCSKERISDVSGGKCGKIEDDDGNEVMYSCNVYNKLECGPQNTCQAFPQQGQPCASICDKGMYCDEGSGTCQFQRAVGRSCTSNTQCMTFYCHNEVCGIPECMDVYD